MDGSPIGTPHARRASSDRAIAIVNGQPIDRQRIVGLLMRAHGPLLFEQVVLLEQAIRLAAEKGLTVTQVDVEKEYRLALEQFADPLAASQDGGFDQTEAERVLDQELAQRNMSREQFRIGIRRNAYLRKICESDLTITQKQLDTEYAQTFGRRVVVRHIQLSSPREVEQVRSRLRRGADFAALAKQVSANTATGPGGGLLDPFTETDEDVPDLLRRAAFGLSPGETSETLRIGPWYHILRLVEILPAQTPNRASVASQLKAQLRHRLSEPAMRTLYERLLNEADIKILDPDLKEAYDAHRRNRRE